MPYRPGVEMEGMRDMSGPRDRRLRVTDGEPVYEDRFLSAVGGQTVTERDGRDRARLGEGILLVSGELVGAIVMR